MRRCCAGMFSRVALSSSFTASTWMRAASAGNSPAMMLASVLLPQPERPNNAVTPGVGASIATSTLNAPRCFLTSRLSIYSTSQAAPQPRAERLGVDQPCQAQGEGQACEARCQHFAHRRQVDDGIEQQLGAQPP